MGLGLPGIVDHLHLDAENRAALFLLDRGLGRSVQAQMLGLQRRDRPDWAHLGHSPPLPYIDAMTGESFDHGWRHRGTTRENSAKGRAARAGRGEVRLEAEPHGRHAKAQRDLLRLEELIKALTVQPRTGQHELGALHRRRIRNCPGIDMKHRHHRAHHVRCRDRDRIGERDPERVQHRGAVAVEHALWVAGGARGIAKGGRHALVEFGPLEILFLLRDQRLVAGKARDARCGLGAFLGHPYNPAACRQMRCQPLYQRSEARIDKEQPICRVVDYVDDLVIEQPGVDRMADRADPGDRVIEFEMAERIPGESADAVAGLDPQPQ
jgi:hypothetical protein